MLRIRSVAVILAGALALCGCSADARHQAGADEEPAHDRHRELRIGMVAPLAADPATLNPAHALDVLAADLLYDGLTDVDPASGEARPELASSWDTPDGVTWTFHLDPRQSLSDGSPLTAAMVVASLDRVAAEHDSSIAGGRLDIVAGFAEVAAGSADHLSGLAATSESDVQITLAAADYELPALLADPAYGVVPNGKADMSSQTVVSGRFRVRSGGVDGATLVALDPGDDDTATAVEFVRFDDASAASKALASGKIDIAPLDDGGAAPAGSTAVVVSGATLVLEVAAANGPWSDPAVHRALVQSLDRSAVAQATTGDAGRRADALVPGGIVAGACATGCAADPAGRTALAALGATSGPVPLDVAAGPHGNAAADEITKQLVAAGLPVEARRVDPTALQVTVSAGQMELALFGIAGTSPTPDPYLAAALSSVGTENLSGYASADFDAALAAARAEPDVVKRRAAYSALEASAMVAAPVIPLVTLGERFAVAERVKHVRPYAGLLFDIGAVGLGR